MMVFIRVRSRAHAAGVTRVAIDETAARRGHDYISLFVDIDQARVLFATEGRDAGTVAAFAQDLHSPSRRARGHQRSLHRHEPGLHQGRRRQPARGRHHLRQVPCRQDHQRGRRPGPPRRTEDKSLLRGTRYIWLRNPANLSERQKATLDSLPTHHLKTARAYQIRLAFQDLYDQPSTQTATAFLKKWYFWATHCRLEPMIDAAHTVKRHWDGILRWFDSKIANGLIEGINSLVQAAKAKARGYRSTRNLKAMVYLLAGKSSTSGCPHSPCYPRLTARNQMT